MKTLYLDIDGVVADFNAYSKKVIYKKFYSEERLNHLI